MSPHLHLETFRSNRSFVTRSFTLIALVAAGCGTEAPRGQPDPGTGGDMSPSPRGGSSPARTGGAPAGTTGGTPGTGGSATGGSGGAPGTGGSATGDSGAPTGDGPRPADAGPDRPPSDGAATTQDAPPAPADAPPPGACKSAPNTAAFNTARIRFAPIALTGTLTPAGTGKNPIGFTELRFLPGGTEFLVSQKGGWINHFRMMGNGAMLLRRTELAGVYAQADCGLISIAIDPDYANNKYVYAGHCTAVNRSKIVRLTNGDGGLTGSVDVLNFSAPTGNTAWHSIGSMGFDKSGNMWALHGEFTVSSNAQNVSSIMGKLLRFIPRPAAMGGPMGAPGNPFPNGPLVYAYGFRSPWRGLLDSRGRWVVGDVGDTRAEEINVVTMPGQNFGWDGSRAGPSTTPGMVNPIVTYRIPNDPYVGEGNDEWEARQGRAVWVGTQYEDCGNDRYNGALTGVYLFGDAYAGWVRGMLLDDMGRKTADRLLANVASVSSMQQHPDGYIYAVKFGAYGTGGLANEMHGVFRIELMP
jgi:hypothetical protein